MSLTRRLLRELELNDNAVERIIAAHVETVDALRQERDSARALADTAQSALQERDELRTLADAHQQEAAAAQEALASYRAQVEEERHHAARRAHLAEALAAQGANPQAIPLLLDAIHLSEEDWTGDALNDSATCLQPYRVRYGALFAERSPLPVTRVAPPVSQGGALTSADVRRMSAKDINQNWSAVRKALQSN